MVHDKLSLILILLADFVQVIVRHISPQAPDRFNPKVTWYFQDPVFMVNYYKTDKKQGLENTKGKKFKNKKKLQKFLSYMCDTPKKIWTHFFLLLAIFSCLTLTF